MNFIEQDKLLRHDFDKLKKKAAYGTAGFRDLAVNMPYVQIHSFRLPLELEYLLRSSIRLNQANILV